MDYIVRDSSIYQDQKSNERVSYRDSLIRAGIVRQEFLSKQGEEKPETKYIVDVIEPGGQYPVLCRRMYSFGGVFNYEEFTRQTYDEKSDGTGKGAFRTRPGDTVLIAYIGGDDKEGVIIGSLKHPARTETLTPKNKPAYASEFNGLETTISDEGAWQIRYRGLPTNADILREPPSDDTLPPAEYDLEIGDSYFGVDTTGSWEIGDASSQDPQSVRIDKPKGTITITSGNITLVLDKNMESYVLTNKSTTFNSENDFNINTKETNIKAEKVNISAQDIRTEGKIDQTGEVSIKGATKIKGETKITGSFKQKGTAELGGSGAMPLVQRILLSIGTGNIGLPVISTSIVLQTSLTKAA